MIRRVAALALCAAVCSCSEIGIKTKIRDLNAPSPPFSLQLTVTGATSIFLQWQPSSDADSYRIERSTQAAAGFAEVGAVDERTTSFSDSGLVANTTYWYRIRSENRVGISASFADASATTAETAPSPPSALSTQAVAYDTVRLSWTDNSQNEDSFVVERRLSTDATYSVVAAALAANATTWDDDTCGAETTYLYRIKAHNAAGDSGYAESAPVTTLALPTGPYSLSATAPGDGTIALSWSLPANGFDSIKIQRHGEGQDYADAATIGGSATSWSQQTGSVGLYTFRVIGHSATDGDSQPSNEDSARVIAPPAITSVASPDSARARLTLSARETGAENLVIMRRESTSLSFAEIANLGVAAFSGGDWDDTTVAAGHSYVYRARYANGTDFSPYSADTAAVPVLAAPAGLAATGLESTATLSWTAATNADGYQILRKADAAAWVAAPIYASVTGDKVAFTDTNVSTGHYYAYRIRAKYGDRCYSDYAESNVAYVMSAPNFVSVVADPDNARIALSWSLSSDLATGYQVQKSVNGGATWSLATTTASSSATSWTDTAPLSDGATQYKVRAVHDGGAGIVSASAYSSAGSATILVAPTTVSGAFDGGATAKPQLSWNDVSTANTGYQIGRKIGAQAWGVAPNDSLMLEPTATATSWQDSGAVEEFAYYYRVRSYTTTGTSKWSADLGPIVVLRSPSGVASVATTSSTVKVSWTFDGFLQDGFAIQRAENSAFTGATTLTATAAAREYVDAGRVAGTAYYYRVRAVTGPLNASAWATPAPLSVTPLAPATNLAAAAISDTAIRLSWTPPASPGFYLNIKASPDGGTTWATICTNGGNPTTATFDHNNLTTGTTYSYQVYYANTTATAVSDLAQVSCLARLWSKTTLDSPGDVGQCASLDYGGGAMGISYYDATNKKLKYLSSVDSGATWPDPSLPAATVSTGSYLCSGYGLGSALALDGAGIPHLSYQALDMTGYKYHFYTTKSGAAWAEPVVLGAGGIGSEHGYDTAIDVLSDRRMVLSTSNTGGTVRRVFTQYISGGWMAGSELDSPATIGQRASLQYSGTTAHAVYYRNSSNDLAYKYSTGGTWSGYSVQDGAANPCAIAVSASGLIHVAYRSSNDIQYRSSTDGGYTWSAATTIGSAVYSSYVSMATSPSGMPCVAYNTDEVGMFGLRFKYYDGSAWSAEDIIETGNPASAGRWCSLKMDASGYAHIAYYDATNQDLKYARRLSPIP